MATRVREEATSSPCFNNLKAKLEAGPLTTAKYFGKDGVFQRKGKLLLAPDSPLCSDIFWELHASPTLRHSDYHKTAKQVAASFYWSGWRKKHQTMG